MSRRRKLVTNDTIVAQNTDSTGEKPHSMKTTIETSDRKWNQYLRVRFQTRVDLLEHGVAHAVLARVDLDHQEQREVVQQGRDRRPSAARRGRRSSGTRRSGRRPRPAPAAR